MTAARPEPTAKADRSTQQSIADGGRASDRQVGRSALAYFEILKNDLAAIKADVSRLLVVSRRQASAFVLIKMRSPADGSRIEDKK